MSHHFDTDRLSSVFRACALTWLGAFGLGLWFALVVSDYNPIVFFLPAVIPVALIVSTVISLVLMPAAVWASRTGQANVRLYGSLLWLGLAAYVALVVPRAGRPGLYGLLVLAVAGIVTLGFIRPRP